MSKWSSQSGVRITTHSSFGKCLKTLSIIRVNMILTSYTIQSYIIGYVGVWHFWASVLFLLVFSYFVFFWFLICSYLYGYWIRIDIIKCLDLFKNCVYYNILPGSFTFVLWIFCKHLIWNANFPRPNKGWIWKTIKQL